MTDLLLQTVARSLDLTIRENINAALDVVWAAEDAADAAYYASLNVTAPTTAEVYPVSYYIGHHPQILQYPVADYPNVVTMCYTEPNVGGATTTNSDLDQIEILLNSAYVEAFVVHSDADTVNRLAWRYAKALHKVITENKSLGEYPTIWEINGAPITEVSGSIGRLASEDSDEWTYVQGCRLEMLYRTPQPW